MGLSLRLGSKSLAAGATALFAVALAVAVAGRGCLDPSNGPESAVQSFLDARASGDREAMLRYLTPASRERLGEYARELTDLSGGERRYQAVDMLGSLASRPPPERIEEVERSGDRARVRLVFEGEGEQELDVVHTDEGWRLELNAELIGR
jgi:hypothetical protein